VIRSLVLVVLFVFVCLIHAAHAIVTGRGPSEPEPAVFCSGDGSATACPCGITGSEGHGCPNGASAAGGRLTGSGSASLAADTYRLFATDMPDGRALYIQGTTRMNGGAGKRFGDGLRCVGGSLVRLGSRFNFAGASYYPGPTQPLISQRGGIHSPGTRTYQVLFRSASPGFCTSSRINLTNGIEVVWEP
jgi:hypothetical protein